MARHLGAKQSSTLHGVQLCVNVYALAHKTKGAVAPLFYVVRFFKQTEKAAL